jgi:excisionase family DNA binding protein
MSDLIAELETRKSFLKVKELATLLSLSTAQIYVMVDSARVPFIRIGSTVRFCPRTVASWLRERTA